MSSLAAETLLTPEEYLVLERKATLKSEYLNGEIRAMPRANFAHNLITVDIATELNIQSRGRGWDVCMSNMRVKTGTKGAYFYPDVVVFCGDSQFEDNVFDTLLNPILVIEVLSPSTEAYDRGEKFAHYQELTSLREYILVSHDRLSRCNGGRPSFTHMKTCCHLLPSDVNSPCRTSTDVYLKSHHKKIDEV